MKKFITLGATAFVFLAMTSCGHGDCDAYHKSDYTKYKSEKQNQVIAAKAILQEISK